MSVRTGSKDGSQSDGGTGAGTTRAKAGNGLFDAVVNKDLAAARVALKAGAEVNKQDENGWTPLRKAARAGDMDMVSLLLENGGNVTENDKVVVLTAASWGRVDALRQILRAKADISGTSEWDISPLVSACQHGHLRAVKLLIEHEADVNQIDQKGNDPLMTAWESNRPEIVFYLVEMGANLKNQEDWSKLAASSTTALKIAEGLNTRKRNKFREQELKGTLSIDSYKTDVQIPSRALCKLVEAVPIAALALLDQVLLLTPRDVPVRADLQGQAMRTVYVGINEWAPKEEPSLFSFAPKDQGRGAAVAIKVLHQKGILDREYLFTLTLCTSTVFSSIANQSLLLHTWRAYVRTRCSIDGFIELGSIMSLFLWLVISINYNYNGSDGISIGQTVFIYCSMIFIGVATIEDIGVHWRAFKEFGAQNRKKSFRYSKYLTGYVRIVSSVLWIIFQCLLMLDESSHKDEGVYMYDWRGYCCLILLSVVSFLRWLNILSYLSVIEFVGPRIIPVLNCFKIVGPFFIILLIFILGFTHSLSIFGNFELSHWNFMELWLKIIEVTRLALLKDPHYFSIATVFDVGITSVIIKLWIVVITLSTSLAISNVLIAIMDVNFDFEQERGHRSFLIQRAQVCLRYYLQITAGFFESPIESTRQFLLPTIFRIPPKSGYLWTCYKIDEDAEVQGAEDEASQSNDNSNRCATQGRLGFLKVTADRTMRTAYGRLYGKIQDTQSNLQKEMRLSQGFLHRAREEIQETIRAHLNDDEINNKTRHLNDNESVQHSDSESVEDIIKEDKQVSDLDSDE